MNKRLLRREATQLIYHSTKQTSLDYNEVKQPISPLKAYPSGLTESTMGGFCWCALLPCGNRVLLQVEQVQ